MVRFRNLFTVLLVGTAALAQRAPDLANVAYGPHERNVLDVWKAKSGQPTPLVVFIHGGGFRDGDKKGINPLLIEGCLNAGLSVAAINYRLTHQAPYPAPMHDGARAIQFLRWKAKEWNIDPQRIAATGGSAGAGMSLWIGFHDDMAEASSTDPVRRESTRLTAMGVFGAQTSYDPRLIAKLIGEAAARHRALEPFYGLKGPELATERAYRLFADASPITHLSAGDPPVFMFYSEPHGPLPTDAKPGQGIHHPKFGSFLKERMDPLGIECEIHHRDDYTGDAMPQVHRQMVAFFQRHFGPPRTRRNSVTETLHGVKLTDPYRWLEDQQSPETRAWIDAQNRYTQSILATIGSRERIHRRLEDLMKIETVSAPVERGGRYFFTKRRADQNQPVLYVRQGLTGTDEVLIDPNPMSADQTFSVSLVEVSDDGKLVVYGIRQGGEDEREVHFLDVESRRDLPDRFPKARYFTLSLAPDKGGCYYSRFTPAGSRVYYHAMGQDPAGDREIFGQGYGPEKIIAADLSPDGRYLQLAVNYGAGNTRSEVYVQDLQKRGPITPIVKDLDALFRATIAGDRMFLLTNWQAPNRRIFEVDLKNPARERWRVVVPEAGSAIEDLSVAGGMLLVNYLDNVSNRIKVFDPSGQHARDIALAGLGTANVAEGRWSSDEVFYSFESFGVPPTIYRYQVSTGQQDVWAREPVPVASDQIEVKQVWYASKDKTRVPMFVATKKGLSLDGARPTLLTGYGGFNISETPQFSAYAALWVEMGGVIAVPNLRGGGEFGEKWHKAGMFENKQNVFDDFIAAAEWLIDNGYTRPSKLAIRGGSNGGLLVGTAMNQRPELFQAVVCAYPLLDMVRYHKFLVARFWVSEYGSADDPKQFPYLYKYSPYHNVKNGAKYPAVMFLTGDADTRVAPLHARKMAALLQAAAAPGRPVLLDYDTKAGHSRALPVSKQIDDLTDWLSFLSWQLGAGEGQAN